MTLAGTRPILQDELLKYELHHRARIAIKPGITGMWQVSGRSDITDLSIISLIQFLCENQNVAELALGFTLALAIFESIAAISEGIMKLQKK